MAAGILSYILRLDSNSFESGMRRSTNDTERLRGSAARAGGGSGIGGLAAGMAGASAVVAGFTGMVAANLKLLEQYAEYDGLVRGLRTLDGTASATAERLAVMREVAKVPGLGFEESVRGDIRLRSVGISAELSERALRAFGNAIATVGGGKADLDGVILALTQIEAKGKISAEEINQLSERVPQVRAAITAAFGTADTEALQRRGISSTEFISELIAELEKVPQVSAGAQNTLDNFSDAMKRLKISSVETGVGFADSFINGVAESIDFAASRLEALKRAMGMAESPGLAGAAGETEEQRLARVAEEKAGQAATERMRKEAELANANVAYWERLKQEQIASDEAAEKRRLAIVADSLAREQKAQEQVYAARLAAEADLLRKIEVLRKAGGTVENVNALASGSAARADAAEKLAERVVLERQLRDIRKQQADESRRDAEARQALADAAREEGLARAESAKFFEMENVILSAQASGRSRKVRQLEEELRIETLKLRLIRDQGLSEEDAAAKARARINLEERAAGRRGGPTMNAEDTQRARVERLRARVDLPGMSNADKLALVALERQLAAASERADPGRQAREDREAKKEKPDDRVLVSVRGIENTLETLATA